MSTMQIHKVDEVAFGHREVASPFGMNHIFEGSAKHCNPQSSPAVLSDISTAIDVLSADGEQSDHSFPTDSDEESAVFPTLASLFEKKRLKKLEAAEVERVDCEAWSIVARKFVLAFEAAESDSEDETQQAHIH